MQIAVTGANGDLGRALVPYLVEQGHTVVGLDRALPSGKFEDRPRGARNPFPASPRFLCRQTCPADGNRRRAG